MGLGQAEQAQVGVEAAGPPQRPEAAERAGRQPRPARATAHPARSEVRALVGVAAAEVLHHSEEEGEVVVAGRALVVGVAAAEPRH